jgi:CubicO group peptidase (beta-lactamase class C family)
MRTFLKWLLRIGVVILVLAIAIALWKREQITRLMAVNSLFSEEKIVANFSNMNAAFLNTTMPITGSPSTLPQGETATLPDSYNSWVKARDVTSTLILQNGNVVFEDYYLGTGPDDLRISWSLAKSFLSALFGIVITEGNIDSIDDPVTKYAPLLKGSAYDKATIKNVLQMSSGVTFDEDYLDYNSDINRMGRVLALGGTMDGFAAGLTETNAPPGDKWKYVSIDTHILGMVIRGATGRSIPDLMAEKLLNPLGLQKTPYYLTDGEGVAFALAGLNLTTRDYARLGQLFLTDGALDGKQIIPRDWVTASTTASANTSPGQYGYGYQWWIPKSATTGEFMARGIYGQYIYINRPKGIVIVTTGADRNFRDAGVDDENVAMFRTLTRHLIP